jgi:hypothetical protein
VKDARTGELARRQCAHPNAGGAATDTSGFFIIQNIRAGRYDVRVTHVGYRPSLLKSVSVNADLRTRLTVQLEPSDVTLDEIVVLQEKPLISGTSPTTLHDHCGRDEPLPSTMSWMPSASNRVTARQRGAEEDDGGVLPGGRTLQDVLSGGISSTSPTAPSQDEHLHRRVRSGIRNALSGVVNIARVPARTITGSLRVRTMTISLGNRIAIH